MLKSSNLKIPLFVFHLQSSFLISLRSSFDLNVIYSQSCGHLEAFGLPISPKTSSQQPCFWRSMKKNTLYKLLSQNVVYTSFTIVKLGCLWTVARSFEIWNMYCYKVAYVIAIQLFMEWQKLSNFWKSSILFSPINNSNYEITNVLPIHSHLTITDFNAWMLMCYFHVFLSMFFMRSPDWFETLVIVRNIVQISFRFWAGEAIWETAVGTWTGLFNISSLLQSVPWPR